MSDLTMEHADNLVKNNSDVSFSKDDSDYYPGAYSSDNDDDDSYNTSTESVNANKNSKNKKNIIYTRKNDTIDKVCDLLTEINNLKFKLTKMEEDRDSLEEKLRLTIMELNTKNVLEVDMIKKMTIMKSENSNYRARIINIRNKALYRKHQVYTLTVLLLISFIENIYNGFLELIFNNILKPILYHAFYSKKIEISVLKNLLLCSGIVIVIFHYKNISKNTSKK